MVTMNPVEFESCKKAIKVQLKKSKFHAIGFLAGLQFKNALDTKQIAELVKIYSSN